MLKNALKYGMTVNEFWNSNWWNYVAYEEAYIERTHEQNHIQGLYNYIALNVIVSNIFKKKGEKAVEYPQTNFYIQDKEKAENKKPRAFSNITKDNLESKYREQLKYYY